MRSAYSRSSRAPMPWKVPAQVSASRMIAALFSPEHFSGDALDPAGHLGGGAAGKRHQQDAARIGAGDDQMGDAVGERIGLAGTGAGNDEQRGAHGRAIGHAMLYGAALLRIERVQIGCHESPR